MRIFETPLIDNQTSGCTKYLNVLLVHNGPPFYLSYPYNKMLIRRWYFYFFLYSKEINDCSSQLCRFVSLYCSSMAYYVKYVNQSISLQMTQHFFNPINIVFLCYYYFIEIQSPVSLPYIVDYRLISIGTLLAYMYKLFIIRT